jgi:AcrR family transcriptional regulator
MTTTSESEASDTDLQRRILGAAFQLFTENGYTGTSTLAIATRAKVSKRDLYAFYPSKKDMLVACIESRSANMRASMDWEPPTNIKMLGSTLIAMATNLLVELCHPRVIAMFRLAIAEAERSREVAQALEEIREGNRRAVAALVARAQECSLLARGPSDKMARHFMTMLTGDLMLGLLLRVTQRPNREAAEEHASEVTKLFLRLYQK